jgi:hypothetical protein
MFTQSEVPEKRDFGNLTPEAPPGPEQVTYNETSQAVAKYFGITTNRRLPCMPD